MLIECNRADMLMGIVIVMTMVMVIIMVLVMIMVIIMVMIMVMDILPPVELTRRDKRLSPIKLSNFETKTRMQ